MSRPYLILLFIFLMSTAFFLTKSNYLEARYDRDVTWKKHIIESLNKENDNLKAQNRELTRKIIEKK